MTRDLKHLWFVRSIAIKVVVCVSSVYEFAKQYSGPWRSTIGATEGAVKRVLGPLYDKVKDTPLNLLVFIDNKLDQAIHKFPGQSPPLAKQVASQSSNLIQKASEQTQKLVNGVRSGGPIAEYKQILLNQTQKFKQAFAGKKDM